MKKNRQKVSIIGLGYVGLPLALALSKSKKYQVFGYDINLETIKKLKNGENPLQDEASKFLDKYIKDINYVTPDEIKKIKDSKIFIITVPTPVKQNFEPDYSHVISASKAVAKLMSKDSYVILESTVNPGTCDEIVIPILEKYSGLKVGIDFEVSHCPERINPGDKKWNVLNIPRNVGSYTLKGNKFVADFYRSFIEASINEVSSLKVAEATKIVENTFRDVNIAFVNELAMSFDKLGIDVLEVINGSSNKPFSFMPHFPGCGVGGHCIPVDPYYLIRKAEMEGFNHVFLKSAREINNKMPNYTVGLLKKNLKKVVSGPAKKKPENIKVGMLGISYKPNVGDIRESPAIKIYKLIEKNFQVKFYDPYITSYKDFKSVKGLEDLLKWADALILATDHKEFKTLPKDIKNYENIKLLVDGRNMFDRSDFSEGFVYKGIGR